ncbi:MAG: MFS transporter, partial [Anaerolineaceae bacterium]
MIFTIHERLPFLALALVAWFLPSISMTAGLILTLLALTWQGLGAGLAANPWQNMIGKIIPSNFLATFFGLQSAVANLLASLGALCAGFFLDRINGSRGFAVSFLSASLLMVVSWFFLQQTREPPAVRTTSEDQNIPIRESITRVFKENKPFVWFLGSRMLFYFGMMAFAFFMVYAVRKLNMSEIEAGVLTSVLLITQTAANIILGRLADRWSRKGTIELGAFAGAVSCLLAWCAPNAAWFYPVIILQGIANTAFWTIGFPILLEFGREEQRPIYVGLGNTLIAPVAILSPILGGLLADSAGYPVTFLVSAILSAAAMIVLHFFV